MAEISKALNRSVVAVAIRASRIIPEKNLTSSLEPKIIATVIEGYHKNETYAKIGEKTGIDQRTLRLILSRAGLPKRRKFDVAPVFSKELVAQVTDLFINKQKKQGHIAKELNVPYSTVSTIVSSRYLKQRPAAWSEDECRLLREKLSLGEDLLSICLSLNKTDFQVITCAKFLDIFESSPTIQQRLPIEKR